MLAQQRSYEIFSDDDSNWSPPAQNKPNRNDVNIVRSLKDVFDNQINFLVPDVKKYD